MMSRLSSMLLLITVLLATLITAESPTTNNDQPSGNEYTVSKHAIAVVFVFTLSLLGTVAPMIESRMRTVIGKTVPLRMRFMKFFSAGTMLGTAYIHLLIPAIQKLSESEESVLPKFFTETYPSMGGVFVLLGTLSMVWLDYIITAHTFSSRISSVNTMQQSPSSLEYQHYHGRRPEELTAHAGCGDEALLLLFKSEQRDKQKLTLFALEAAIALHSVIIGVMLGITRDGALTGFAIAVVFHQFLEGYALGTLALAADLSKQALVVMITLFSMTTTTGAIIGVVVSSQQSTLDMNNVTWALVEGIVSGLAAGTMIYSTLVQVLQPELTNAGFYELPCSHRWLCLAGLVAGVVVMGLVAKWA